MSGPASTRVALATCAAVAELDPEGQLLVDALRAQGCAAVPAVWDDDTVDWAGFDAVVVRSTWDYAERRAEFLAWAARVDGLTRLLNPLALLELSTDKHYLADLQAAGLPVVPSAFVEVDELGAGAAEQVDHPFLDVEHVVKPAAGAGSRDALRLGAHEAERSRAHVRAVLASGRAALVQPYLRAVDEAGETALVFLDGELSHAMRKGPLLRPGAGLVEGLFAQEEMSPRRASAAEEQVGRAALQVAAQWADGQVPLYARVDLLPDDDGAPCVLELELVEPSLFLDHAPGAAGRLAEALLTRLH